MLYIGPLQPDHVETPVVHVGKQTYAVVIDDDRQGIWIRPPGDLDRQMYFPLGGRPTPFTLPGLSTSPFSAMLTPNGMLWLQGSMRKQLSVYPAEICTLASSMPACSNDQLLEPGVTYELPYRLSRVDGSIATPEGYLRLSPEGPVLIRLTVGPHTFEITKSQSNVLARVSVETQPPLHQSAPSPELSKVVYIDDQVRAFTAVDTWRLRPRGFVDTSTWPPKFGDDFGYDSEDLARSTAGQLPVHATKTLAPVDPFELTGAAAFSVACEPDSFFLQVGMPATVDTINTHATPQPTIERGNPGRGSLE